MISEKEFKEFIKYDQETQNEVLNIHQLKLDTKKQVVDEKTKIYNSSWDTIKQKVEDAKKALDHRVSESVEVCNIDLDQGVMKLNTMYQEHKEQWKQEILKRCIGD